MQNFYEFTNLNSSKLQWPQEIYKRSIDCKHFKIEPEKWFFRDFFGSHLIFEIHGCCSSEPVDPTKNVIETEIVEFQKVK